MRFLRLLPPNCKTSHFPQRTGLCLQIRDHRTPRSGLASACTCSQWTPPYFPFPLFVALRDHNPPKLQTDRRTDGRHVRSISAKCLCCISYLVRPFVLQRAINEETLFINRNARLKKHAHRSPNCSNIQEMLGHDQT